MLVVQGSIPYLLFNRRKIEETKRCPVQLLSSKKKAKGLRAIPPKQGAAEELAKMELEHAKLAEAHARALKTIEEIRGTKGAAAQALELILNPLTR